MDDSIPAGEPQPQERSSERDTTYLWTVAQTASRLVDAGISVVSIRENKRPKGLWKKFQNCLPTKTEIAKLFTSKTPGVGAICGGVSGGLECIDFDDPNKCEPYAEIVSATLGEDFLNQLPLTATPSGGQHLWYRCAEIEGNQKLAEREETDAKTGKTKRKTLIETRGEGGYAVVPPSGGRTHPTGKPYVYIRGDLCDAPEITPEQRDALLNIARSLTEIVSEDDIEDGDHQEWGSDGCKRGARPGDALNEKYSGRRSMGFHVRLLEKHGWTHVHTRGEVAYIRRPGSNSECSATVNYAGSGLLYVFSTNASPFEAGKAYTPFAVFTLLERAGDYTAAAKALANQGFGGNGRGRKSISAYSAFFAYGSENEKSWPDPVLFDDFNLPPFPSDAFCNWLGRFVEASVESVQVPPALPALLALSVCATSLMKKFRVFVKEGYSEPLNLYTVTVLAPGNRKSAVFRHAVAPLMEYEKKLEGETEPLIRKAMIEKNVIEVRIKKLTKQVEKEDDSEKRNALADEIIHLQFGADEIVVPSRPRLTVDDITAEKLASLLCEQGGKMGVFSAEGDIFNLMAGRYSNGTPNFAVFLKGHSGDQLKVDRITRPSEIVDEPLLTIGLTVQPAVICGLYEKAGFRGLGLLARFLYAFPASTVGRRNVDPPPFPSEVCEVYRRNVTAMLEMLRDDAETGPTDLYLNLGADGERIVFAQWLEPKLAPSGEFGGIADWAGKLVGTVLRIAGILHVAKKIETQRAWTVEIEQDTMLEAIRIGKYLLEHAKAAFDFMGADEDMQRARLIFGWIKDKEKCEFSRKEVFEGLRSTFKKVDELDEPLSVLIGRSIIRPKDVKASKKKGRPPSPRFILNPKCLTQNTQNTQKSESAETEE